MEMTTKEYRRLVGRGGGKRKGNKYNARKVTVDGVTFDSGDEARRYNQLKLLQAAGEIAGLELQPAFELQEAFTDRHGRRQRAITYRADFAYTEPDGTRVVEDVKGVETAVFKLKKKMFLRKFPHLELRIVRMR